MESHYHECPECGSWHKCKQDECDDEEQPWYCDDCLDDDSDSDELYQTIGRRIEMTQLALDTLCLIIGQKPRDFTAITIMRLFQKVNHDTRDWHEFSSVLDRLHNYGVLTISGYNTSGMTIYNLI